MRARRERDRVTSQPGRPASKPALHGTTIRTIISLATVRPIALYNISVWSWQHQPVPSPYGTPRRSNAGVRQSARCAPTASRHTAAGAAPAPRVRSTATCYCSVLLTVLPSRVTCSRSGASATMTARATLRSNPSPSTNRRFHTSDASGGERVRVQSGSSHSGRYISGSSPRPSRCDCSVGSSASRRRE